jgi:hypothetical protein
MSRRTVRNTVQPMVGGGPPSSYVHDVVVKNLSSLLTGSAILGFDTEGFKLSGTISHHSACITALGGNWMRFYKYKMAAWVACQLGHEPPASPPEIEKMDKPEVLIGGRWKEWISYEQRKDPMRHAQIVASLETAKRVMERPGEKELKAALKETFEVLTTERTRLPSNEDSLWQDKPAQATEEELERILEACDRVVDEVFRGQEYRPEEHLEPFFFSTSANYIRSRTRGGAVGEIMASEQMRRLRVKFGTKLITGVRGGQGRTTHTVVEDSALVERFRQLYEMLLEGALLEEKKVELVALAEALKVRVISKGPAYTYSVLKPLQKWMWGVLKGLDTFRLVGEPVSGQYLVEQLGRLRDSESYLSGDYKAATDNLDSRVSDRITQRLARHIKDRRLIKLFKDSLTGHTIVDPEGGVDKKQLNGQLMGSITSFPILCIANAAICLLTREHDLGRRLTLRTAGLSINGDDCAFRSTESGRKVWERLARASGMAPSVGKYFFSREFVNMNSTRFNVWHAEGGWGLRHVKRVNLGLVAGMGRVANKTEHVQVADWGTMNSVARNCQALIDECPEAFKITAFAAFRSANWDKLTEASKFGLAWFLPEHLGGLGLPTFPDYKVEEGGRTTYPWMPDQENLRLASAVHKHANLPKQSPPGVGWGVWQYATRRAAEIDQHSAHTSESSYFLEQEAQTNREVGYGNFQLMNEVQLRGLLCVESLFTCSLKGVFKDPTLKENEQIATNERYAKLRKVQKEIARVKKLMGKCEPFTADALPTARRDVHEDTAYVRRNARSTLLTHTLAALFLTT